MQETQSLYFDLKVEASWIDYLRIRLPYSFKRVDALQNPRRYRLSDPELVSGAFSAKHHNYWKRGHSFYVVGKLTDNHGLQNVWSAIERITTDPLLNDAVGHVQSFLPITAFDVFNAIQSARLWALTQGNILDRERVAMSNILQAVELCLKDVTAHALFRERQEFLFPATHDIPELFENLPIPLRDEIESQAKEFAQCYVPFRQQVETAVRRLNEQLFHLLRDPTLREAQRREWERLTQQIQSSDYTAFVNANDPGSSEQQLHDDWFPEVLDHLKRVEWMSGGQYFRYSPSKDVDELPPDLIHRCLLLGRFVYEHLFPVTQTKLP